MGRFSDLDLDNYSEYPTTDELPDFTVGEPDGETLLEMQVAALLDEVNGLIDTLEKKCHRIKYYGELMLLDEVERVIEELKRIKRDFR